MNRARVTSLLTGALLVFISAGAARCAPAQPQFISQQLQAGALPHSVVIGDWNEDGLPDIAASNRSGANVSVFLATAPGVFAVQTVFSTVGEPYAIASGDLNGDGHIDLVTAGFGDQRVGVLLGNGHGSFVSAGPFLASASTISIAVRDMNGDGKQDIITANYGGPSASVFFGDGVGGISGRLDLPAGGTPWAVAVGDLDLDGKPEIVTANEGGGSVSVFKNLGSGQFAPKVDYAVVGAPRGVAIGRLNADLFPDVAVQNGNGQVSVFLGDGTGALGERTEFGVGTFAFGIAIGDINLDAVPDIVSAQAGLNQVSTLLGLADGTYQQGPSLTSNIAPRAVALGDLDKDGAIDIVAANEANGMLTVFLNRTPNNQAPTTTSILAEADSTTYGQALHLSAVVTPASATGAMSFSEGPLTVGLATIVGGQAAITLTGLVHGDHPLTATYQGNAAYAPSTSAVLNVHVRLAATVATVTASLNPALQHVSTTLTATVAGTSPESGTPLGSVRFSIDGATPGPSVALVAGVASAATDTLGPGAHSISATYIPQDTLHHAPSTSIPYSLVVEPGDPRIVAVTDVPKDQGQRVFVKWHCPLDQPGQNVITGYRVWRRVPATVVARVRAARPASWRRIAAADSSGPETFWEDVADLGAARLVSYGFTSSTFDDSTSDGIPYTAFFIQALTADPLLWFNSAVDSGYSVDNLAPGAPSHALGTYASGATQMHWHPNQELDLREYRIYRGASPNFAPSVENLAATTTDTTAIDAPGQPFYYKVVATDIHGNSGSASLIVPAGVLDVRGGAGVEFALSGTQPNPASGRLLNVRFSLATPEPASLELIDVAGRAVFRTALSELGVGEHLTAVRPSPPLKGGVYLLRLTQGHQQRTLRVTVVN